MEVNQKELAKILGVTDRRIRQLKNEFGLFQYKDSTGKINRKYELEKCVPEYINYKLETEIKNGTTLNKEKEQAEHELIKKNISKLKLRKMKKELHYAVDVEEFLTNMLVYFKAHLLSLPQKAAPLVQGEEDVNNIQNILEKEIFETLDELIEYDPYKIDKEKASILDAIEDEMLDEEEEEE